MCCAHVCGPLAVSKAFKTLENEEGYKRCQEIVEEAKSRVDEAVSIYSTLRRLFCFLSLFSVLVTDY